MNGNFVENLEVNKSNFCLVGVLLLNYVKISFFMIWYLKKIIKI